MRDTRLALVRQRLLRRKRCLVRAVCLEWRNDVAALLGEALGLQIDGLAACARWRLDLNRGNNKGRVSFWANESGIGKHEEASCLRVSTSQITVRIGVGARTISQGAQR